MFLYLSRDLDETSAVTIPTSGDPAASPHTHPIRRPAPCPGCAICAHRAEPPPTRRADSQQVPGPTLNPIA